MNESKIHNISRGSLFFVMFATLFHGFIYLIIKSPHGGASNPIASSVLEIILIFGVVLILFMSISLILKNIKMQRIGILLVAIIVLFDIASFLMTGMKLLGVVYEETIQKNATSASINTIQESIVKKASVDVACNGEANEYYDLGFGFTQEYKGTVAQGKEVNMTLSCDHTNLFVTGAVDQTIVVTSESGVKQELSRGGPHGAVLDTDYNFDGYNDILSLVSAGQGYEAVDSYYVFLYQPKTNKFLFNEQLSNLQNIVGADATKIEIYQSFNFFEMEDGEQVLKNQVVTHTWKGEELVKVREVKTKVESN